MNHTQPTLRLGWISIAPRFPLHQDEFYVILDYRVRLVGLTEKLAAVISFETRVRYLVPDDRVEVVKTDFPTRDADIRVEGHDDMSSERPPRQAYIANNTN